MRQGEEWLGVKASGLVWTCSQKGVSEDLVVGAGAQALLSYVAPVWNDDEERSVGWVDAGVSAWGAGRH